jgi:cystathionine beta-lyase/cystathionine gamma-synthase
MTRMFAGFGLSFSFVDTRDVKNVERALTPATKLIYCETPTNPMMFLTDLRAVADLAAARGILVAVDNTFATPVFQRPLELGCEVVLHSTTKYLNGHSDMVGGLLVTSRDDLAERLGFIQNASGAVPGPMDCWLALRGTKTLPLRMHQHDANGRRMAEWLQQHPRVKKLYYAGLASHPQHELARRQMSGFGGMISFDVGDVEFAKRIVSRVRLFQLAESLGGVESLIGHPASMTHASVPLDMREKMGLTDSLVRLSVGIEDVNDLIADLDQAMG